MASAVEIANFALTRVGDARIISFDDATEVARVISTVWDPSVDAELRSRTWNFSVVRTSIPALLEAPSWGFTLQYQLPSDCLRVIQVDEFFHGPSLSNYRNSSEAAFKIEGRKILTNLPAPLKIRYVSRVTDSSQWDGAFVSVFACRIAIEICERLAQSTGKREFAWKEYDEALKAAQYADATERQHEPLPDNSWIMSRL